MQQILEQRKEASLFRSLQVNEGLVDFCSNDYLSFARSGQLKKKVKSYVDKLNPLTGSTGSRSISGNSDFAEELENLIADFHHAEAGLIFNSGYDANVGFFSSVPQKGDLILYDELCHASIRDGIQLSYAKTYKFNHNDFEDL